MPTPGPWRRARHGVALVVLGLVALSLVGRAVVEVVTVDPARPETYRHDWGGPHYLGVILVHAGPGLLIVLGAAWYLIRGRRRTRDAR